MEPWQYLEESCKIRSVRPAILLSILLSRCFLGIAWLVFFFKFGMVLESHVKLCVTEPDFLGKCFFPSKIGKMDLKWANNRVFFNLLENLVINFYWIWSIMKIYIICCVPAQIPYLGKFLFLRYGPKCSQPIRLQDFLINHISRTNQWNSLIFYMLTQLHIN